MAKENRNPDNAKPAGGRKSETNPARQAGQATPGAGNVKGQRMAQQQGAGGTMDQAPDAPGQERATRHAAAGLRQGTVETEERED